MSSRNGWVRRWIIFLLQRVWENVRPPTFHARADAPAAGQHKGKVSGNGAHIIYMLHTQELIITYQLFSKCSACTAGKYNAFCSGGFTIIRIIRDLMLLLNTTICSALIALNGNRGSTDWVIVSAVISLTRNVPVVTLDLNHDRLLKAFYLFFSFFTAVHIEGIVLTGISRAKIDKEYYFKVGNNITHLSFLLQNTASCFCAIIFCGQASPLHLMLHNQLACYWNVLGNSLGDKPTKQTFRLPTSANIGLARWLRVIRAQTHFHMVYFNHELCPDLQWSVLSVKTSCRWLVFTFRAGHVVTICLLGNYCWWCLFAESQHLKIYWKVV